MVLVSTVFYQVWGTLPSFTEFYCLVLGFTGFLPSFSVALG